MFIYRIKDGTLVFAVADICLSHVIILGKSVEGLSISGRREPGSAIFRRPEAIATVLSSPFPHQSGPGGRGTETSTVFEYKCVVLRLALTTLFQIPDQSRPAVKSNERAIMEA